MYGECATRAATTAEGTGKGAMMTTTITREERERVAKLLGFGPFGQDLRDLVDGVGLPGGVLKPEDLDRVAQALRDAEGEASEVVAGVMDFLRGNPWKDPGPLVAGLEGAITAAKNLAESAGCLRGMRDAAPQWREVTETEPAKDIDVLIREEDGHCEVGWVSRKGLWMTVGGRPVKPAPTHWMPLPAPPEVKPAPAPAPQAVAQPGASEAARIEALERTVAELALAVERLSGGAK